MKKQNKNKKVFSKVLSINSSDGENVFFALNKILP